MIRRETVCSILFLMMTARWKFVCSWAMTRRTASSCIRHGLFDAAFFGRLRGGQEEDHHSNGGEKPQFGISSSSSRLFSTTSSLEAEAKQYASQLCNDRFTHQSLSEFGGIQYYNTDIDSRFRVLFVLGGPGAGKGTQSDLMVEQYPVAHFSVGELLRNIPDSSEYKDTVERALVAGKIVPVEISLSLLQSAMEEATKTMGKHILFLVDGFPRNYDNLSGWVRVMKDTASLEAVLVYQCPLQVLQDRILERAKSSGRSDDNLESVRKRFETFEQHTVPVVDILRNASQSNPRWSVQDIAGDESIADVWLKTQQVLNRLIIYDVLTANAALLDAVATNDIQRYEDLCDPLFFDQQSVRAVLEKQENPNSTSGDAITITYAQVEVITGKQVAVSYNRQMNGVWMREKRFWSYQGPLGWRNVHFVRTPVQC